MGKDLTTAKLIGIEIERNKMISKKKYIVGHYLGLSHLHDGAQRASVTITLKNIQDTIRRQMAINK